MCSSCHKNCKKKSWAKWTRYPKIFDVYWGNFSSCEYEDGTFRNMPDEQIIQNRNEFVHSYLIKSGAPSKFNDYIRNYSEWRLYGYIDHVERYKTHDNKIVIISSPYMNSLPMNSLAVEDIQNYYQKNGWVQIKNLYTEHNTSTFMLSFENPACKSKKVLRNANI